MLKKIEENIFSSSNEFDLINNERNYFYLTTRMRMGKYCNHAGKELCFCFIFQNI